MKLFKKSFFRNKLPRSLDLTKSNQSGQAMIEYVLVVIISVTMLFLVKGLFSNVNNYISGYVGGYFKCLMTQGELPALGVSDTQNLARHTSGNGKCTASLDKTKQTDLGGSGTKNSGTTTPLSSEKSKGSTLETASRRAGASASNSKKSSQRRQSGSNGDSSDSDDATRFSSNVKNRSEAYSTSDGEESDGVRIIPAARVDSNNSKSEAYRPITGELDAAIKKQTRGGGLGRRDNSPRNIILPEDDLRPGTRRSKFIPHSRAVAAIEEEPEVEMGFGYFMKWIMIAGIGIALFIFFGGQVMNYNNSDGG